MAAEQPLLNQLFQMRDGTRRNVLLYIWPACTRSSKFKKKILRLDFGSDITIRS